MSVMKNGSVQCNWCGKLSRSADGYYLKPDGQSAGYIHQPDWERFPGGRTDVPNIQSSNDICEECAADLCPFCGSKEIVKLTPTIPGPSGWGGRCKTCCKRWGQAFGDAADSHSD